MTDKSATDAFIEERRKELNELKKDFDSLAKESAAANQHAAEAGRLIERLNTVHHITKTQIQKCFNLGDAQIKMFQKAAEKGAGSGSSTA